MSLSLNLKDNLYLKALVDLTRAFIFCLRAENIFLYEKYLKEDVCMELKEFYKKYNLNHTYFGEMAHVGARTLRKYELGEKIREDSKARIEKAIFVVEKYDCVRPSCQSGFCYDWVYRSSYHMKQMQEYHKRFEYLLKAES
jgi:hypothetical protein